MRLKNGPYGRDLGFNKRAGKNARDLMAALNGKAIFSAHLGYRGFSCIISAQSLMQARKTSHQ